MAFDNESDVVRINGKVYTRNRARALGLLDSVGEVSAPAVEAAAAAAAPKRGPARNADRKDQREPTPRRGRAAKEPIESGDTPAKVERIQPLKPQNVTPEGEPVQDEATLAAIAAEAEAKAPSNPHLTAIGDTEKAINDANEAALLAESQAAHDAIRDLGGPGEGGV